MLNEICEDCLNRVGYENLKLKQLKYLCSDCLNSEQNIKKMENFKTEICYRCEKIEDIELMYKIQDTFLCEICAYDLGVVKNENQIIPM